MSTPTALIRTLQRGGCRLVPDEGVLRVQDPYHTLTDELRQAIRQHKSALLAILHPKPPRLAGGLPVTRTDAPCAVCGEDQFQQHVAFCYCLTCGTEMHSGAVSAIGKNGVSAFALHTEKEEPRPRGQCQAGNWNAKETSHE